MYKNDFKLIKMILEAISDYAKNIHSHKEYDNLINNFIIIKLPETCPKHCNNKKDLKMIIDSYYNLVDDVLKQVDIGSLLFVSEFLREEFSFNRVMEKFNEDNINIFHNILEVSLKLQKYILSNSNSYIKKGRKIESDPKSPKWLADIFRLLELELILELNQEYLDLKSNYEDDLFENMLTSDLFRYIENEKREKIAMFNNYILGEDHIEEDDVENEQLKKYLEDKGLDLNSIRNESEEIVFKYFGFYCSDINKILKEIFRLNNYGEKNKKIKHHISITEDNFIKLYKDIIEPERLKNITQQFMVNNLFKDEKYKEYKSLPRMMELRPIYEYNSNLNFGVFDLMNYFTVFMNTVISGQYGKELGLGNEKVDNYRNDLTNIQNKISNYFSYRVADILDKNGYILPKNDAGLICVDIEKIHLREKEIVFNDIDVLALDDIRKILYNFELKYSKLQFYEKGNNFDIKFKKLKERVETILNNKELIIKEYFNVQDSSNFELKTIILTSRKVPFNIPEYAKFMTFYELKKLFKENKNL
ncbi:hypothetical protein [Tissierella sp.]|uniref:hypothetical protein n=1 Tax=Tissierella sp. TaxID=41274 RepID=UPI0030528687